MPVNVLDIGCGCGKIIGLFKEMNIKNVIGQDIAKKPLDLCKIKYPEYEFTNEKIENLKFEDNYFDLVTSRRVLSAVTHDNIENVMKNLCRMAKRIYYINEYQKEEFNGETSWWFMHDFGKIMHKFGFQCAKKIEIKGDGSNYYSFLFVKTNI